MKNLSKVLALVLVVAMVFSLAVSAGAATSFKDDASVNYDEAVQLLSALNVLNGYDTDGDGKGDTFKPGANITRAELTVMLSYMVANEDAVNGTYNDIAKLNADYKTLCSFADSKAHWAAGFIAFCAGNGFISGRAADTFDPEGNVTVAEAAVMLLRVLGYDAATEEYGTTKGTVKGYNTQLDARNAGLLNGLEAVDFFAAATREQVAQLFLNALDAETVGYNYTLTPGLSLAGTVAYGTGEKLVESCFWPVTKINAYTENGLLGHQWVSYLDSTVSNPYYGRYVALTDVFVDDTVIATFPGGTAYATIAATLGVTAYSTNLNAVAVVNGYPVNEALDFADRFPSAINLPGAGGSLREVYTAGTQYRALDDNCTLQVVRDYDTAIGRTVYKFMYYYEFVATIGTPALVAAGNLHAGEYAYPVTYYWDYACAANCTDNDHATAYIYAATKDAYDTTAKYLVVPNESFAVTGSSYPVYSDRNAFLSVKVAEIVAPFVAKQGDNATFSAATKIVNGTTVYNVSDAVHTFYAAADYNKTLGLVKNSAGYVIGYVDASTTAQVEKGYVYVDSVEFSETVTPGASWLNQYDASWYAQSKAQVYFPSETGNANYTIIDLKIDTTNPYAPFVAISTANWAVIAEDDAFDGYVAENGIMLRGQQTNASVETAGAVNEYVYVTNNLSNIRVYNNAFDGWYKYEKYTDGTYKLVPVDTNDTVTVAAKTGHVGETGSYSYLTDGTTVYNYSMDLNTMTAVKTLKYTGYMGIPAATYGGTDYAKKADGTTPYILPYLGKVGGEVTVNALSNTITNIEEFYTVGTASKYDYTLFTGKGLYNSSLKQYALNFVVAGGTDSLYLANEVYWINGATGNSFKFTADSMNTLISYLEASFVDSDDADSVKDQWTRTFQLTIENGKITAIKFTELQTAKVVRTVANGYVVVEEGGVTINFKPSAVWNCTTGAATAPAAKDTIYYVDGATIPAMFVRPFYTSGTVNPGIFVPGFNWGTVLPGYNVQ